MRRGLAWGSYRTEGNRMGHVGMHKENTRPDRTIDGRPSIPFVRLTLWDLHRHKDRVARAEAGVLPTAGGLPTGSFSPASGEP